MAIRPQQLIGLGTAGLEAYRYLGRHWPEARSIPERQVLDRRPLHAEPSAAGVRLGAPAHACTVETRFGQAAEDAQCAAIAALS